MSASSQAQAVPAPRRATLGTFERYLTLWIALCIVAGIALGAALPGFGSASELFMDTARASSTSSET
jgi:ACR3 family arsenite efflux pump ArsB